MNIPLRYILIISLFAWVGAALGETPPADFSGAKWIWAAPQADQTPDTYSAGSVYFRVTAEIPQGVAIQSAEIILTADNLFILHVNDKPVGESEADDSAWSRPKRFDVTPQMTPGRNVLAVEAVNTIPGPAGLIAKLIVQTNDGRRIEVDSDDAWRYSEKEEKNWRNPGFDDKDWRSAFVVAEFGAPPWGRVAVGPKHIAPGASVGKVRAMAKEARKQRTVSVGASVPVLEATPPAEYAWPEAIAYVGDDCSLYRPLVGTGSSYDSLSVTIFNPRHARAFPEHDLPAPLKVGHKLYAMKPARPGTTPRVLVDAGKGALGSPSVSFDGKWIYVSMVPEGESFFHIYRVGAEGGQPQQLTHGPFHDIDPAELPDGRLVFTSTRIGTFEEYHSPPSRALFVMNSDGGDIHPISSTIIFDNEPEVLADGRILFIRSDNFFDRGKVETMLHAVHPDGTEGYTEFALEAGPEYGGRLRSFVCGSPAPLPDGRVAFVSGPGITLARPGNAIRNWRNLRLEAGDVAGMPDGRLISTLPRRVPVAIKAGKEIRTVQDIRYEKLVVIDRPDAEARAFVLLDSTGSPLHSPVYLGARPRPPVLPPRIDPKMADDPGATGVLFCQNARFTQNTTAGWSHVRAIRVLAGKGLTLRSSHSYIVHAGNETVELGTVPLAPDGSFAIRVPADTPIALQAVDAEGRSELNEMSWITVRPGETRGCIGCHQSRQSTPLPSVTAVQAAHVAPLKLTGQGQPFHFRGNNAAVTGLMELQFDRYREVAGINRHSATPETLATSPQEVQRLIQVLNGDDDGLKISSAQRLAIFRDRAAAAALGAKLQDADREVRVAVATALAACGTRESAGPLLNALDDSDPLVAQASAVALENLTGHAEAFDAFKSSSERASQSRAWREWLRNNGWDAIEQDLIRRLASSDRDIVRRAAVSLGHIGKEAACAALREYVVRERDNNPFPEWRRSGHHGDGTRFNSLEAVNPRTLQAAVRSLGYLKDADAVGMLAETLTRNANPETGNLFLAEAAIEAMGRIGTPQAETAMIAAFALFADYPQYSAWYGDHGALIACHASPLHYRVVEALDAMGSTQSGQIVPHLIRSVPTDPDRALLPGNDDCETLVGRVIRRSGRGTEITETCLAILGDAQATKTKDIAAAIGVVQGAWAGKPDPENRAAQMLSLVCRDRSYEPRIRAAFNRYRAMSTNIQRVFNTGIPVVNALPIKHWVCFFLARTLGNLADPASTESLVLALDQSPAEAASGYPDPLGPGVLFLHNDLTPCWRAEVAWALGRLGDKRAVSLLFNVIADLQNAPDTRHAAAEALATMADAGHAQSIRKLAADYPEVSTRRTLLKIAAKFASKPE